VGKHFWNSRESDANKKRAEQLKKNKEANGKSVPEHPRKKFHWFKKSH